MNTLNKSIITILSLSLIGATAMPVMANAESESSVKIVSSKGLGSLVKNPDVKSARTTYNQAIKSLNTTYKSAHKTARTKFRTALSSAGTDLTKRMSAYTTYLSDMLTADNQRSSAKSTAMQTYINVLSAIKLNP